MILTAAQKKILNVLLDKYEKSATFRGENKVNQSFSIRPEDLWPKYLDDAEYDLFVSVNEDAYALEQDGFVVSQKSRGRIIRIGLNTDGLDDIYKALGRTPRNVLLEGLTQMLRQCREEVNDYCYEDKYLYDLTDILNSYIEEQLVRISAGRMPEYFEKDYSDYQVLWKFLISLMYLEKETFVRDLSVKLYNDSKRLGQFTGKAAALLYKYGNFPEKETVLEECGVINNPSYIMIKGPVIISFGMQSVDLGKLHGGLAFSADTLSDISEILVYGKKLITIENLTSFHRFDPGIATVAVYLGGYHNRIRRDFLRKLFNNNANLAYFHFGDIDAGGFYIYEHLCRKTGIPFKPWKMNRQILEQYKAFAKPLSVNDFKRITKLREYYIEKQNETSDIPAKEEGSDCKDHTAVKSAAVAEIIDTLGTMLELGLKLEQEAVQ